MVYELPSGYKFVPVNKAVLVETIPDDIFETEILGVDPNADVKTAGGMIIPGGLDIDHNKSSFTNYAKGRVIDVAPDCSKDVVKIDDVIIYNVGGTIYRNRGTGNKIESVPQDNIIVVCRNKGNQNETSREKNTPRG